MVIPDELLVLMFELPRTLSWVYYRCCCCCCCCCL